ncbi:MAG: SseB family protein [Lachnospiraceae bacterium]|nr:SseB family protein [Lachnospiraceae bacterium]
MNLTKCASGHFYDSEKNDKCPHCVESPEHRAASLASAAHSFENLETCVRRYHENPDSDEAVYSVFLALATKYVYLPVNEGGAMLSLSVQGQNVIPIFTDLDSIGKDEDIEIYVCFMKDFIERFLKVGLDMILNPFSEEELQFYLPYESLEKMLLPLIYAKEGSEADYKSKEVYGKYGSVKETMNDLGHRDTVLDSQKTDAVAKIEQCVKGHSYDSGKYLRCPVCEEKRKQAIKVISDYFFEKELNYEVMIFKGGRYKGLSALEISFSGESFEYSIFVIVNGCGDSVSIISNPLAKIPYEKRSRIFEFANDMNFVCKSLKFSVEPIDNGFAVEYDLFGILDFDSVRQSVFDTVSYMSQTIEWMYPKLMEQLWSKEPSYLSAKLLGEEDTKNVILQTEMYKYLRGPASEQFAAGSMFDFCKKWRESFMRALMTNDVYALSDLFRRAYALYLDDPGKVGLSYVRIKKENDDTDPENWNVNIECIQGTDFVVMLYMPVNSDEIRARLSGIIFGEKGDGYYFVMLDKDEENFSDMYRNNGLSGITKTHRVRGSGEDLIQRFLYFMKKSHYRLYDINLYSDSNCYEDFDITIHVSQIEVYLREHTSEHAPGESYGLTHKLDEDNSKKFLECFGAFPDFDPEAIRERFRGEEAVALFQNFCKEHGIVYVTSGEG